jgi:hypothetical protein
MQYFNIEYTERSHYVLFDRNDFEQSKSMVIASIDYMMDYLREARDKIAAIKPGAEHQNLVTIADGLYDEYEHEGYQETSGCCYDTMAAIWRFARIADNLYNQEQYSGKIEENWRLFR